MDGRFPSGATTNCSHSCPRASSRSQARASPTTSSTRPTGSASPYSASRLKTRDSAGRVAATETAARPALLLVAHPARTICTRTGGDLPGHTAHHFASRRCRTRLVIRTGVGSMHRCTDLLCTPPRIAPLASVRSIAAAAPDRLSHRLRFPHRSFPVSGPFDALRRLRFSHLTHLKMPALHARAWHTTARDVP